MRASTVQIDSGALTAHATGQVRIESHQTQQTVDETHQSRSKSLLGRKTTTKRDTADNTLNQGSTLSATAVGVSAGQNIAITGSNAVSNKGTTLNAQGNVSVEAAQDRLNSTHSVSTRQSGLMGTGGGVGVSIGTPPACTRHTRARQQRTGRRQRQLAGSQHDVQLLAAQNTSSSANLGVKVDNNGPALAISGSKGTGHGDGDETTYTNTHVEAWPAPDSAIGRRHDAQRGSGQGPAGDSQRRRQPQRAELAAYALAA